MKLMNVISTIAISMCIATGMHAIHAVEYNGVEDLDLSKGIQLDTLGGIAHGKECFLLRKMDRIVGAGKLFSDIIVCKEEEEEDAQKEYREEDEDKPKLRKYAGIVAQEGAATGTPPGLMFTNYIGSHIKEDDDEDVSIPGAKRRVMYFKGVPDLRK